MSTTVEIEHAVTITTGGILFTENDVVVIADVHNDGEVRVKSVCLTGVPLDNEARRRGRPWPVVPMSDSSDPHMMRAAEWFAEILGDDEDFLIKARDKAGVIYVGMGSDPDGGFKRVRGYA
jgi:hypothetical protein